MQVPIPHLQPRCGHCVAAFSLSPGITEVVIFGGNIQTNNDIADTKVLRFGECKSVVVLDERSKPQTNLHYNSACLSVRTQGAHAQ